MSTEKVSTTHIEAASAAPLSPEAAFLEMISGWVKEAAESAAASTREVPPLASGLTPSELPLVCKIGTPYAYHDGVGAPEGLVAVRWVGSMEWGAIDPELAKAVGAVEYGRGWVVEMVIDGVLVSPLGLKSAGRGCGIMLGRRVAEIVESALLAAH